MSENIFDGMSKEEITMTMDILYILSDANRKSIEAAYLEKWEEEERRRQAQRDLEDVVKRAMGDF